MQPLNPLTLNLQGQILIEASAGTGKTYTIALLFLRLLLEKGLSVDEILVVTFTRAATEELRDRIRQRIREALDVLEGQETDDPLLRDLLDRAIEIIALDKAAILLGDALTRMDEAAIYTIHGFCQRMLQDHAFESGAPFEMEFLETEQLLRNRIIEDFWRRRFYPAGREEAAWAASLWESPAALLVGLGGHLGRNDVECLPTVNEEKLARQTEEAVSLFVKVQIQWREKKEEVAELLRENKRLSRDNSKGYGLIRLASALEALDSLIVAENMPWLLGKELDLFTTSKIQSSLKKNKHEPPSHSFFDLFEEFFRAHSKMNQSRRILVLLQARNWLGNELARRKQERSQLSFDDLLTQLDAGLEGINGERLARSIGTRFPVIMVDEFQDTDPLQYRIFATVYRNMNTGTDQEYREPSVVPPAGRKSPGLFLIGDPKQAIYSFRGADIFTYIQARQDTPTENQLTMATNYRSSTPMVRAVNQIFAHEAPFLFSKSDIDFLEVEAAGLADNTPILLDNKPLAALTCLLLPEGEKGKPLAKGTAADLAARFCAHEIADLLAAGLAGKAKAGDRSLAAGDFAVLVRTHAEANLVRKELNALSITSVYYSQDSVFSSREARQVFTVMTSLNDLADSALIRTALATDLFGYTAERLDRLRCDELEWENVMRSMTDYRRAWQQQGVIPMLQKLLQEQRSVSRLHASSSGERMLTNFLHLAELLQEAARSRVGANALLRWFSDQMHSPEQHAENQQLRLESDENLVKIVTIHKSKGMEYPLVFLPFLWASRPCSPKGTLTFHRSEQPDRLCIDLGTDNEEHFNMAERERLSEDLRLLYVAVTRARYGCFFCWGGISKMENSALCYLLHNGPLKGAPPLEQINADLVLLRDGSPGLAVKPFPDRFVAQKSGGIVAEDAPLMVTRFKGKIDSNWRLTSYSSLTASHEAASTQIISREPQPERPDYDETANGKTTGTGQAPGHDVFGFPKGAAAGTCLHTILEEISFNDSAGHEAVIETQLARAGFADTWLPVVSSWMRGILDTGLPTQEGTFALFSLRETERVNEMSFYFPLESMQLNKFNRVLREFFFEPLPDRHEVLEGLMVGFIDLVFRCDGRYYVADYKSNHLGDRPADYHRDNLETAMLEHRYDLQYLIYTLALHRFLKGRIRNYDYAEHFGGIFYLFLRGMHPEYASETGVFSACPPFALIDALDQCCAGR